eukprot:7870540-Ditylum_brightwellii.AAC.1
MVTMNLCSRPNASHGGNRDSRRESPGRHKASAQESEEESKNSPSNHPKRKGANYGPSTVALNQQTKSRGEMKAEANGEKSVL